METDALTDEQAEFNFTALAFFITHLLGKSESEIRKYFFPRRITALKRNGKTQCLELRKDGATALCFIDDGICRKCFLFPDNSLDVNACRQICNEDCMSFGTDRWQFDERYVQLAGHGENVCFYFYT